MRRNTEDIGVFEVDGLMLERVSRIEEHFTLPVELDGAGWLVNPISLDDDL